MELYEYLIQDINKIEFDDQSRFWIHALADLKIEGDFFISIDDETWTHYTTYNMKRNDYVFIYTEKVPRAIEYTGRFEIGGNLLGLVSKNGETAPKGDYDLESAFSESSVVSAQQLVLPEDLRLSYKFLFAECITLKKAPRYLPASAPLEGAYIGMFRNCRSLVEAPELPATQLSSCCYRDMFFHCIHLTQAPELPATQLVDSCYQNMFTGCKRLNYIKVHAEKWIRDNYTYDPTLINCTFAWAWVFQTSNSGMFYKPKTTNIPTGVSGVPDKWTVVEF